MNCGRMERVAGIHDESSEGIHLSLLFHPVIVVRAVPEALMGVDPGVEKWVILYALLQNYPYCKSNEGIHAYSASFLPRYSSRSCFHEGS